MDKDSDVFHIPRGIMYLGKLWTASIHSKKCVKLGNTQGRLVVWVSRRL